MQLVFDIDLIMSFIFISGGLAIGLVLWYKEKDK